MMQPKPYPLTWPLTAPRTAPSSRVDSRFGRRSTRSYGLRPLTLADAREGLLSELDRFRASDVIISANIPLRLDGLPASGRRAPDDPGVAVYFVHNGRSVAIACDQYRSAPDNMRAVAVTIESLRRIARHGSSNLFEQAFSGFAALPASTQAPDWMEVLGVGRGATLPDCEAAYKRLVPAVHPDRPGGSAEAMVSLNAAIQGARKHFAATEQPGRREETVSDG